MDIYFKKELGKVVEISDLPIEGNDWIKISTDSRISLETELKKKKLEIEADDLEETVENIFSTLEYSEKNENNGIEQKFKINHRVVNRSFGELVDMFKYKEIDIPEMQRELVWDSIKCSRLIESILFGLPIPPLFFMEINNNRYEVIDGVQRLNTLFNFIEGKSWKGDEKTVSRLSKVVSPELRDKCFRDLDGEAQRNIRRSTIPLIEFSQTQPDNYNSKYMIFERINTGAEKLNPMQIRKSLAYGTFIKQLYEICSENQDFGKLFTQDAIRKDRHVEAFLRVFVMQKIVSEEFIPTTQGIKEILNDFCENHKDLEITGDFLSRFEKSLKLLIQAFDEFADRKYFRSYSIVNEEEEDFVGRININIMEALIGNLMLIGTEGFKGEKFIERYKREFLNIQNSKTNPFSTSTGTLNSIKQRFKIAKDILRN